MKQPLVLAGKLAVFVLGAYLSGMWMTSYWCVGPIFGIVVVIWAAGAVRDLISLRSGAFVAASTVIYALVVRLHTVLFQPFSSHKDYSFLALAAGTILLPVAHALCLKASWKRVMVAIPGLYASTFAAGWLIEVWHLDQGPLRGFLFNGASVWQGLYLLFLFGRRPRG
ncbi:MAG: hypothetical protein HY595_02220 [Candidatus Omnitrophica bacterium]|nr:hypothetical protein [Candidatus Omnitrophota bacterium]